jgi:hypothetical protein
LKDELKPIECVVSFNCRVEGQDPIKVVLLGVTKEGKYFDAFDATDVVPKDELAVLRIKARHQKENFYRRKRR